MIDNNAERGDVWTAAFDDVRPLVVLSALDDGNLRCVVAVEPAEEDISGVAVEVDLDCNGRVVRVALPQPGHVNCTWVVTLARIDLVQKLGRLSAAKIEEVDEFFRMGEDQSM